MLNHPEHNWGLANVAKWPEKRFANCSNNLKCWSNAEFQSVRERADWKYFSDSWVEGRAYLFPATDAARWSKGFRGLVDAIRAAVPDITPTAPPMSPAAASAPTPNPAAPTAPGSDAAGFVFECAEYTLRLNATSGALNLLHSKSRNADLVANGANLGTFLCTPKLWWLVRRGWLQCC